MAQISDAEANRLSQSFIAYLQNGPKLEEFNEKTRSKKLFTCEYCENERRASSSSIKSAAYLKCLAPKRLHRQFDFALNPNFAAAKIQALYKGYFIRKSNDGYGSIKLGILFGNL